MTSSLFLRLNELDEKSHALRGALSSVASGQDRHAYLLGDEDLQQVPGSPFAYWISSSLRSAFNSSSNAPLESQGRDAQSGASTMNDFRFLRTWWEVRAELLGNSRIDTLRGKRWVPLAKGGRFSPYYTDWELVIDWVSDGQVLKQEVADYRGSRGWGYSWTAALNGHAFYFRPGLTWPRRTQSGLSVRLLPGGGIFGDKGPALFVADDEYKSLLALVCILNSSVFRSLVEVQMTFGSFEVGVMERTPIPLLTEEQESELANLGSSLVVRHA